jgi:hypothetical protein
MEYGNSQIQHDPIIVAFATAHWLWNLLLSWNPWTISANNY